MVRGKFAKLCLRCTNYLIIATYNHTTYTELKDAFTETDQRVRTARRYLSMEQAQKKLCQARLALGLVAEEERDDVPAGGKIIRQDPEAGSLIERGSAVGITLAVLPPRKSPSLLAETSARLVNSGDTHPNGPATPPLDNTVPPAVVG